MKAGLLTIHDCYNFGAVLQASATIKLLSDLEVDTEMIDYVTPDLVASNSFFKMPISTRAIIDDVRNLVTAKDWYIRAEKFNRYKSQYYSLSNQKCRSLKDFNKIKNNYDVFITGSDQTFNLHLMGSQIYRYPFFLGFTNQKKISFASSMGDSIDELTETEKKYIREHLLKFDTISVRDKKSSEFIGNLLQKDIPTISDPTICVDVNFWKSMLNSNEYRIKKYILFYSVVSAPWVVQKVCEIGQLLNMPVVAPHMSNRFELGKKIIRKTDSGPIDFIRLISEAALVVTTSFHATVFSLLFHTPFFAFQIGEGNRIGSLLSQINYGELFLTEKNTIKKLVIPNIDFNRVDSYFDNERNKAKTFLKRSIMEG